MALWSTGKLCLKSPTHVPKWPADMSYCILLNLMHQTYLLGYATSLCSNENNQNLAKVSFESIFSVHGSCCYH